MKKRRNIEAFSLSFLDCICCGFGAIVLLLVLSKIYDPKNETPIIALDMNMYGLFFSFGTLFGGNKTRGDEAYKMMLKNDYIRAADKFKQFLNVYTDEFRYDDAKEMLNTNSLSIF